jgi:hypothetical protein
MSPLLKPRRHDVVLVARPRRSRLALYSCPASAGGTSLTWDQLYALPTDPTKLEPVLRSDIKGADPNPTAELYTVVGDLLRESPAPPALREALYEVAADIPGVKVVGHYKDALGRTGTAVERDDETLVIDPNDGQLLADIEGNPNGGCPAATAASNTASPTRTGARGQPPAPRPPRRLADCRSPVSRPWVIQNDFWFL